jgi:hypothetical protein
MMKFLWCDITYRFRCAFSTDEVKINRHAGRLIPLVEAYMRAGQPYARIERAIDNVVHLLLWPVWTLRGWGEWKRYWGHMR